MKRFVLRQRRDPELDLRDGADPPFAAQDQLAQVRPGSRSRHIRYGHRAVRRLDARAREHLLDAPVAQRLLAGRAGGDPAANGGQLKGLRKMAERVAVLLELPLKCRAGSARAEGCDLALPVQRQQAVHPFQGKGQHRLRAGGNVDVASHGGSAAIKNDGEALAVSPLQHLAHVLAGGGQRHAVRKTAEIAGPHGQPIGKALPAGVADARFRACRYQRMGRQPRFGHPCHDRSQAGIGQNRARPVQELVEKRQRLGFQRKVSFLPAPAIPPAPAATQVPIQSSLSPKMAAPSKIHSTSPHICPPPEGPPDHAWP